MGACHFSCHRPYPFHERGRGQQKACVSSIGIAALPECARPAAVPALTKANSETDYHDNWRVTQAYIMAARGLEVLAAASVSASVDPPAQHRWQSYLIFAEARLDTAFEAYACFAHSGNKGQGIYSCIHKLHPHKLWLQGWPVHIAPPVRRSRTHPHQRACTLFTSG